MEQVKLMRQARGMSQRQLAAASGVDQATISLIETGRRPPQLETLVKLANALQAEMADFFPKVQAPLFDPAGPWNFDDWTKMFITLAKQKRAALADLRRRTEAGGGSPEEWAALTYDAQNAYMDGKRLFADVTAATVQRALLLDAIDLLGNVASEITAGYRELPEEAQIIEFSRDLSKRAAS